MKRKLFIMLSLILLLSLAACGMPDAPEKAQMQEDTEEYITKTIDSNMQISYFSVDEVTQPDNKTCTARCVVNYENQSKKCVDLFELKYQYVDKEWEIDGITIDVGYSGHAEEILEVANESEETIPASEESEEPEEPTTVEEPEEPSYDDIEISDEIFDFEFVLCGKKYKFPLTFEDLEKDGWELKDYYKGEKVGGHSFGFPVMIKEKNEITFSAYNTSGNTKVITDCVLVGIEVNRDDLVKAEYFSIAKGINTESTPEEIQSLLGAPSQLSVETQYTIIDYYQDSERDNHNYYHFRCYSDKAGDDSNTTTIEICKKIKDDVDEASDEIPSYISKYKAPTSLEDIESTIIEIDGYIYEIPCPLSEFIKNGWTINGKLDSLPAKTYTLCDLKKGDNSISITLTNFSDNQTLPENCAVTRINLETSSAPSLEAKIGKLSLGDSTDKVKKEVTSNFEYTSSEYYEQYRYSKGRGIYIWLTAKKDGLNISIQNESWDY